jgi:tetratricopeptide (TPR) repeat protein
MKKRAQKDVILTMALVIAGFAAVFFLSSYIERSRVSLPPSFGDDDLSFQGKRLKGYALGAEGLMADWYWMQSLQYIGNKMVNSKSDVIDLGDLRGLNPRLLFPLLDNATDLDPKFMAAYSYGATVLPAVDAAQAIKLSEKGIANNPGQWRLYQYLGYIYWQSKDYDKAAEVYEAGSRIEGAPIFFKQLMALMKTQGGDRNTARQIYSQTVSEAPDQSTRYNAKLRLQELDALDEMDAIDAALNKAKSAAGACPQRVSDIIPYLRNVNLPSGKDFGVDGAGSLVDPSGAPYLIDRQNCKAIIDPNRSKLPKH